MRILYITPKISGSGGVARVLSIKTNYFSEKFKIDVHILTQNEENISLFYDFTNKTRFHYIKLTGNRFQYLFQYIKGLNKCINQIKPDIIIVCDNGLKGYFVPWLLQTKIPILFESHGSRYIEEKQNSEKLFAQILFKLKFYLKKIGIKSYDKVILLSNESKKEWNLKNVQVIPNPNWFSSNIKSKLDNKKAISVSRYSYEKGIDRLLLIWQKVTETHPDWILDIYGEYDSNSNYVSLAKQLQIDNKVNFKNPVKDIQEKYQESSIYLMTSRSEGFPMVLLEAMSFGLPVVAYDCPIGPRAIITNNTTGFLINDGDEQAFANKVSELIENIELRKRIGANAKEAMTEYTIENVMEKWQQLFNSLISK
ncbi:glycosyltransferase family 4 protein [Flavobacterium sp.]|uniref:glycosyltransferase family 4 protein n=1 Tax=Flavobacterium sp. TaxID=239 RepID=UPI00374C9015